MYNSRQQRAPRLHQWQGAARPAACALVLRRRSGLKPLVRVEDPARIRAYD